MKVIFLDVDGVLNQNRQVTDEPGWFLRKFVDPAKMKLLNDLVKLTGAVVVVSSTWRIGKTRTQLADDFFECGFEGRIIGKTESLGCSWHKGLECGDGHRGAEIAHWLRRHGDVESYVIIDDDADMGDLITRLVHVNGEVGLTGMGVVAAAELLSKDLVTGQPIG